MSDLQKNYDDEIDLLDLIEKVWDGKWKIALFIIVGIFIAFGYNFIKGKTSFIATTEIRPITTFETDKYRLFNDTGIFQITEKSLLNLYIENIEQSNLLEIGIEKFKLIKQTYDNDKDYIEKAKKFASEIFILKPQNMDGKEKGDQILYHTIKGEYSDIEKWKELLVFIDFEANKKVKNIITNRFETIISVNKQKRDFEIEDFNTQIENVKEDYEKSITNRLAFLKEQASIARKLGVQKNTIETQNFSTSNSIITNFKSDNPFYLRGYEAIEEEVRLTEARKNKSAFMPNLIKLEELKRNLEQNKKLQRTIDLFANTPIKQGDFKSTSVNIPATNFITDDKSKLYYILAIILSGMIGVVYVLIANSFANRKKTIVTS